MEGLAVDDETGDALGVVRDNVGRALLLPERKQGRGAKCHGKTASSSVLLPLEGLLAEKVALVQVPNELLFLRALLLLRDLDLERGADSNSAGQISCVLLLPIEKK